MCVSGRGEGGREGGGVAYTALEVALIQRAPMWKA